MPELEPQKHGGALNRGGRKKGAKDKVVKVIRDALVMPDGAGTSGILSALIDKAKSGDVRAIELCLQYGIGKPDTRIELTGEGGGPVLLAPALAELSDDEIEAAVKRIESGE